MASRPQNPARIVSMEAVLKCEHLLSRRELQICDCVERALTNKEIARELGIVEVTVKAHVKNILCKKGLRNRVALAIWWHDERYVHHTGNRVAHALATRGDGWEGMQVRAARKAIRETEKVPALAGVAIFFVNS